MTGSFSSNIHKLYLIKLSKWFMLIMPVAALFYNANGLSIQDIYILQSTYSLSVALVEIPSGYFADVIGRKKSLIFGSFLGTLGFIIYSLSQDLSGFLIAEIILGLGGAVYQVLIQPSSTIALQPIIKSIAISNMKAESLHLVILPKPSRQLEVVCLLYTPATEGYILLRPA